MWLSSSGADPASLATLIDSLYKHDENTQIQIQAQIDILTNIRANTKQTFSN